MSSTLPKAQLILDYKIYFGVDPSEDRISLIKHIDKKNILSEIVALNYRLKPKDKVHFDNSFNTQVKELTYFTKTKELFIKYSKVAEKFTKNETDFPNIFNRQACLFAIEEITNSNEIGFIDDFILDRVEDWEAIIKYLLAVNHTITQIREEEEGSEVSFEALNPKLLPLNELSVEIYPIFTLYRGYSLIDYFRNQTCFSVELNEYFLEKYEIEPDEFIFQIMSMYFANNGEKKEHDFYYVVNEDESTLFDKLSERTLNKDIYKLISIRKSPFICLGNNKYLITDNFFLIEKIYSQFLNDFWFDKIKKIQNDRGKPKYPISFYRSQFGYFFESYLSQILINCFENYKYSKLLMFDELKIDTSRGQIEIADVYFRNNNKILLGQVKSGSIYDVEKFGGSIEELYKNDRNSFFENFGVNQIIESLGAIDEHIIKLDPKFPKGHAYEVYPCIIVNDKAFQTPLMADTFNLRFQELLSLKGVVNKVRVKPLTLIHISDFEILECLLNKNPKMIWELLQFNFRDRKFIPPFGNSINIKFREWKCPKRMEELIKTLTIKYNSNEDNVKIN